MIEYLATKYLHLRIFNLETAVDDCNTLSVTEYYTNDCKD